MDLVKFNNGKVRLGFSPYTYARVAVMKSSLLKKDDYGRILKMGAHEIIRLLQEGHYRQEMEEYNVSEEGTKTIEIALNANLMRNFNKLYHISDTNMQKCLATYLLRYDLENIKMILRSKFTKVSAIEVEPLLYHSITLSPELLKNILTKNSPEEVIRSLGFLKNKKINYGNLFEIENALDNYYLHILENLSNNLTGQGKVVARFLRQEIEAINLKTIIKFKTSSSAEGTLQRNLENYLVAPSSLVKKIISKSNISEIVKILSKHKYTSLQGEEKNILAALEIDMDVSLLKKESLLMHQHILSANYILGYFFAKEIEVRNLKALIKGKKLGVSSDYLEKLLVIAA